MDVKEMALPALVALENELSAKRFETDAATKNATIQHGFQSPQYLAAEEAHGRAVTEWAYVYSALCDRLPKAVEEALGIPARIAVRFM
jgi:hypothetical protein